MYKILLLGTLASGHFDLKPSALWTEPWEVCLHVRVHVLCVPLCSVYIDYLPLSLFPPFVCSAVLALDSSVALVVFLIYTEGKKFSNILLGFTIKF